MRGPAREVRERRRERKIERVGCDGVMVEDELLVEGFGLNFELLEGAVEEVGGSFEEGFGRFGGAFETVASVAHFVEGGGHLCF